MGSGAWPLRVFDGAVLVRVHIVPILTQLKRITVHVVKAPCVRLLVAHAMRSAAGIIGVPGVVIQLGLVVAVAIPSSRFTGPAAIFPLGLRGQAIFLSLFLG